MAFKILFESFGFIDAIIIIAAFANAWILHKCFVNADKVYRHFNRIDHTSNLTDDQKEAFSTGKPEDILTPQKLLEYRENTNRLYALFTNFTSIFPLLGMFGTVWSLLSMGDLIGSEVSSSFFTALSTTFWGILAAIIFKAADSAVSYRIDDNEKHLEYLFNPKKGE